MTVDELIKILKEQVGKEILLTLQGIIETTISINKANVRVEEKVLFLENKEQKVGFNLSQLMKISCIKPNEFFLEFDQLQNVTITILDYKNTSA